MWERDYKQEIPRSEMSPEPTKTPSFLEAILNKVAPILLARVTCPNTRQDELFLYLAESPVNHLPVIEY
jgi:hypothetical protein